MPILSPCKALEQSHELNQLIQTYNLSTKDDTANLFSQLQAIAECAKNLSPKIIHNKQFIKWEKTDQHGLRAHLNSVLYTLSMKSNDIKRIINALKEEHRQSETPSWAPHK